MRVNSSESEPQPAGDDGAGALSLEAIRANNRRLGRGKPRLEKPADVNETDGPAQIDAPAQTDDLPPAGDDGQRSNVAGGDAPALVDDLSTTDKGQPVRDNPSACSPVDQAEQDQVPVDAPAKDQSPNVRRVRWEPSLEQRCDILNIEARINKLRPSDRSAGIEMVREIAELRLPRQSAKILVGKIAVKLPDSYHKLYSDYHLHAMEKSPAEPFEERYEGTDDNDDEFSAEGIPEKFDFEYFDDVKDAWVRGIVRKGRQHVIIDICGFVRVIARAVDENNNLCGYEIEFLDHAREVQRRVISERQLSSDGTALFQELGEAGLKIRGEQEARASFRALIRDWTTTKTITIYSRPGWHRDRTVYVCPTGEIIQPDGVPDKNERLAADVRTTDCNSGGSLQAWKDEVGFKIWGGDTPQFAAGLLAGVAGTLLPLKSVDGFGLYFHGPTESGKTTSQIIAAGVVGNPQPLEGVLIPLAEIDDDDGMATWFNRACSAGPHVDDTKTGKARKVEEILYQAASGSHTTVWTASSEVPLCTAIGSGIQSGSIVRLIPVDVGAVPRINSTDAAHIKRAARDNYGWVLPAIVKEILRQREGTDADAFTQRIEAVIVKLPGYDAPGRHRATRAHGALWVAGELLQAADLIPARADIGAVVRWVWANWQKEMAEVSGDNTPLEKAVRQLVAWTRRDGDGHLHLLTGAPGAGPAWGWLGNDGTVYIRSDKIVAAAGGHVGRAELVSGLRDRGMLTLPVNPTKNTAWKTVPGRGQLTHYRLKLPAYIP